MRIAAARLPNSRGSQVQAQTSNPITLPAPSNGLVTTANFGEDIPASALILDNWVTTKRGARIRRGSTHSALLAGLADVVEMFDYRAGGTEKLFAATAAAIFDITTPPAPPSTVSSVVSSLTGGDWTSIMHTTPGGSFLVIANGADAVRNFDGTTWTSPAITGVTPADLNFVWLFKNREFFVENDTLDAWYLPVDSVAGAASAFPLGGVFEKGGTLLAGFSWSVEAGDGINDLCCFMSTEGEVAVYAGTDPSGASTWALRGVYNVGRPLGKHAMMEAGGDVLIGTVNGLIPFSQAFNKDQVALQSFAVSKPIEDLWLEESLRRTPNWKIKHWPEKHLAYVSFPALTNVADRIFVVNTLTGRWSTHSGWSATCWGLNGGQMTFGAKDGKIYSAELGMTDDGSPYQVSYLGTFQSFGDHGQAKSAKMASAQFFASAPIIAKLFVNVDYDLEIPTPINVMQGSSAGGVWDTGLWDSALWGALEANSFQRILQNVRGEGDHMAIGVSMIIGGTIDFDCELLLNKVQIESGELRV